MFMTTRQNKHETCIRLSLVEEVALKKPKLKSEKEQEEQNVTEKGLENDQDDSANATVQVQIVPLLFSTSTVLSPKSPPRIEEVKKLPRNNFKVKEFFKLIYAGRLQDAMFSLNFVNIVTRAEDGRTPLMACLFVDNDIKRRNFFNYFLKCGASHDTNIRDHIKHRDILAWCAVLGRHWEFNQLIDLKNGDVNYYAKDLDGCTYLHLAVQSASLAMVRLILGEMRHHGLSIDTTDKNGFTSYILARRLGYKEIAEVLQSIGHASVEKLDDHNFKTAREWSIIGSQERTGIVFSQMSAGRQKQLSLPTIMFIEERQLDSPITELYLSSPTLPALTSSVNSTLKTTMIEEKKNLSPRLDQPQIKIQTTKRQKPRNILHSLLDVWSEQAMPSYRSTAHETKQDFMRKKKAVIQNVNGKKRLLKI